MSGLYGIKVGQEKYREVVKIQYGDVTGFVSEGLVACHFFWRVFGCFVVLSRSRLDFASASARSRIR